MQTITPAPNQAKARLEVLVPVPGIHTTNDLLAAFMAQAEAVGATLRPAACRASILSGGMAQVVVAIATPTPDDLETAAQALRNLPGYPARDVIVRH